MTPKKMLGLVAIYELRLKNEGIPKVQVDSAVYFGNCTPKELLAHAHYLCDEVRNIAEASDLSEMWDKANRLFAALQMCTSFAGWYTLGELRRQNS